MYSPYTFILAGYADRAYESVKKLKSYGVAGDHLTGEMLIRVSN